MRASSIRQYDEPAERPSRVASFVARVLTADTADDLVGAERTTFVLLHVIAWTFVICFVAGLTLAVLAWQTR